MMRLVAHLHILGINLTDRINNLGRDERGEANTVSIILWAVAVVGLVAIAVLAIRTFITTQTGKLG